ncbi:DUF445 domain-containing protein [Balneola sp. MJW-20]|uniref:DUF445 domain-containing protein n=1 Tax=Gracilimonas aurantiaca TaxID=3234185 RepID=UPI003466DFA4
MDHKGQKDIIKQKNKEYATQLWDLLKDQIEKHSNKEVLSYEGIEPPRFETTHKWLLILLYSIPYFLVLVFGFSFYWDFEGFSTSLFGYSLNFEGILRILSISGLIGFLTNWLAITMLFRPSQKRPILGQGLIPAQKDRIAYRLARAVSEDLINPEIIKRKIHESQIISRYREKATEYVRSIIDDPGFRSELKSLLVSYVDEMIADPSVRANIAETLLMQIEEAVEENSFEKVALKAYSFLKGQEMQDLVEDALTKLPTGIEHGLDKMDTYLDDLPDKINDHSDTIEQVVTTLLHKLINQLDVQALVEDNLRQYDEKRLERLIKNASNDQLKYIQYLGAILGTFGGLIIWEPIVSIIVLTIIIVIIAAADNTLHYFQKTDPK